MKETRQSNLLNRKELSIFKKINNYLGSLLMLCYITYFIINGIKYIQHNSIPLTIYPILIYFIGLLTIIIFNSKFKDNKIIPNIIWILMLILLISEFGTHFLYNSGFLPVNDRDILYPMSLIIFAINTIVGVIIINFPKYQSITQYLETINVGIGLFGVFYYIVTGGFCDYNFIHIILLHLFSSIYLMLLYPNKGFLKYLFVNDRVYLKSVTKNLVLILSLTLIIIYTVSENYLTSDLGITLFALIIIINLVINYVNLGKERLKNKQSEMKLQSSLDLNTNIYELIVESLGETILFIDKEDYILFKQNNSNLKIDSLKNVKDGLYSDRTKKYNTHTYVYNQFLKAKKTKKPQEIYAFFDISGKEESLTGWVTPIYIKEEYTGSVISLFNLNKPDEDKLYVKHIIEEKNLLISEIHHRVKNNLQVINSLLSLQLNVVEDKGTRDILLESQLRIRSIGLVHETFYKTQNLETMEFTSYIKPLINEVKIAYITNQEIDITYNVYSCDESKNEINLNMDDTTPLGLIINEFITNSLKYAFPDNKGKISINFIKKNDNYTLILEDNGQGFDQETTEYGLGLNLISSLCLQLEAEMKLFTDNKTRIELTFKNR
ncbi:MAG: sensor histidine kinase [Methanobacteriaceae archaeon]|nr:sensor histidine kinase [Methanobacteriaceae archaeon]